MRAGGYLCRLSRMGGIAGVDCIDGVVAFGGDIGAAAAGENGDAEGEIGGSAEAGVEGAATQFGLRCWIVNGHAAGHLGGVVVTVAAGGVVGHVKQSATIQRDAGRENRMGEWGGQPLSAERPILADVNDGDALVVSLGGVKRVIWGDGQPVIEADR